MNDKDNNVIDLSKERQRQRTLRRPNLQGHQRKIGPKPTSPKAKPKRWLINLQVVIFLAFFAYAAKSCGML